MVRVRAAGLDELGRRLLRLGLAFAVTGGLALGHAGTTVHAQSSPREYHVAPTGLPGNDGSPASPLDLVTALGTASPAQPGDTIWVHGGTYTGNFVSSLTGTSNARILVRAWPGERVTLDGVTDSNLAVLTVGGHDTWFQDLEVTNSSTQRLLEPHNVGMNIFGPGTKAINVISHDNGGGFGLWSSAVEAEIYGSIIYNVGWEDVSQGTGHSLYTQNATGTRRLTDNILFNGFSFGIHAYTEQGAIDNMRFEGNVAFNHGVLSAKSGAKANILLGGGQNAHDAIIINNYLYQSPGVGGRHFDLGWGAFCDNPLVSGNYAAGSARPILLNCQRATVTNNTFIGSVDDSIKIAHPTNTYLSVPPPGVFTVVRKNNYEEGRGHVIIYNWDHLPQVSVDVSETGLQVGDVFEVRDPQNYFGSPVLVGTYTGGPVTFPMSGLTVAGPIGNAPLQPTHTGPEFAVFVIKKLSGDISTLPPMAQLGARPMLIAAGQSTTLSWSSALATAVSIDQGVGPVAASGSLVVFPSATKTYALTASNAFGSITSSATVSVGVSGTAAFVRSDTATQGNWKSVYGADGYSIAADGASIPAYAVVSMLGQSQWVWSSTPTEARALQRAVAPGRIASTWYHAPAFYIDVTLTDGQSHSVALHMVDWDQQGRSQTIDVFDGITNSLLDSRTVSSFQNGRYLVWELTGRVRFKMTSLSGANAVVSAIFFDAPGGGVSPPSGPLPTATLDANPLAISPGGQTTLSWSSSNAATVAIDQGVGPVTAGGTLVVSPAATTTYTLTAQNSVGTATKQVTVTVAPLPTATVSVTPSVNLGQAATLTWSTSNATSVSIYPGIGAVTASGNQSVTPLATTTYVLSASNSSGSVTASATVTVVTPPPGSTGSAQFVRADLTTQGSWKTIYGSDGYALAADATTLPAYAQTTFGGQTWTWASATPDLRGLQRGASSARFAATWYASSFNIDVNITDGQAHTVALYMVDWDRHGRNQVVEVIETATNTVLDSRSVPSFQSGQYLVWDVTGRVRFRTTAQGGPNAVISGIFFAAPGGGTVPPDPPPTATLTAAPVSIAPAASATLTRSTANATSVSIDQGIGTVPAGGSQLVSPASTTTYTLTAQNAAGVTVTRQATVTVTPLPGASLSVTPSVTAGQPATLTWSTSNATSTSINQGIGPVAPGGSLTVTPATTTTYTLTASNNQGTTTATATVTVTPGSPPPGGSASARFLRTDTATQGNWRGAFGADGHVIAAGVAAAPGYAQVTIGGPTWIWAANSADARALQNPTGTGRQASTWYGSSFNIDVTILDAQNHTVGLYLLDWDSPFRTETVEVIDPTSNTVLDTRSAAGFQNGLYLLWDVSGRVRFRITRTGGANAVLSGIFFDSASAAPPPGNRFLRTDSTTQGTWKGTYGADGYALASDGVAVPAFATLTKSGQSDWVWNPSTSDARALQTAAGPGRIAATWYTGSSQTFDFTVTDGQTHNVALYMLDWDTPYRSQIVELIDPATGVVIDSRSVANFATGVYVVYQIAGNARIRVTRASANNAVVSGVFFGAP